MPSASRAVFLIVCTSLAAAAHSPAMAQAYPTKPVRIIVPWTAGGTADTLARILGQRLGDSLGQQVLVDNRAGASGQIGT